MSRAGHYSAAAGVVIRPIISEAGKKVQPVVEELLDKPAPDGYLQYLGLKLRSVVDFRIRPDRFVTTAEMVKPWLYDPEAAEPDDSA